MSKVAFLALFVLTPLASVADAQDNNAAAFTTCAACHLPDGVGVPGAFPPVRDRAAKIAALDGGRAYLIAVVSYGLMGTIQVEGVQYFGVMAGNMGAMDEADIAAALNHIVFGLGDGEGQEPFTAEEVLAVQAELSLKSPAGGGQIREKLVSEHGDQWP